jgi:hypothetical protein
MKVTRVKTTKEYYFSEIKTGDIFKYNEECYLKIVGFGIDYNAVSVGDWECMRLDETDIVIPVKSELIIEE